MYLKFKNRLTNLTLLEFVTSIQHTRTRNIFTLHSLLNEFRIELKEIFRFKSLKSVTRGAPVICLASHGGAWCVQQAGDPERHWEMMMMLGPEGAQPLRVTPAGAESSDTTTGGPWPLPRPAPLRSRYVTENPGGAHTKGREKACMKICKMYGGDSNYRHTASKHGRHATSISHSSNLWTGQ
jgi:hypothetical protein